MTVFAKDMMFFPIHREVWSSIVPEIEWLKISTLLKLGAHSIQNSRVALESRNQVTVVLLDYGNDRSQLKMTDLLVSDIQV